MEIGKTYDVDHTRKGKFRVLVTAVNDGWVEGRVVSGVATALLAHNVREMGEKITIRAAHATFTEVQ